jgi:ferrochelatase
MKEFKWALAFQSRSGPVEWLEPGTDDTIIKMAGEGVRNLFIVQISFVSDHIETLYEIDILFNDLARKHGVNLKRCRSLNTSEKFIHALKELVLSEIEKG